MNQTQNDLCTTHRKPPLHTSEWADWTRYCLFTTSIQSWTFSCLLCSPRGSVCGLHHPDPFHLTSGCVWLAKAPIGGMLVREVRAHLPPLCAEGHTLWEQLLLSKKSRPSRPSAPPAQPSFSAQLQHYLQFPSAQAWSRCHLWVPPHNLVPSALPSLWAYSSY